MAVDPAVGQRASVDIVPMTSRPRMNDDDDGDLRVLFRCAGDLPCLGCLPSENKLPCPEWCTTDAPAPSVGRRADHAPPTTRQPVFPDRIETVEADI